MQSRVPGEWKVTAEEYLTRYAVHDNVSIDTEFNRIIGGQDEDHG